MVDLSSGMERLPPEERLKRLRELEEEKRRELNQDVEKRRKELEEELAKKRKELEELEKQKRRELEETESLEERTIEELTRERAHEIRDLETQLREFREGRQFLPEGGEGPEETARPPPGFSQSGYESQALLRAHERLDYLLHAEQPSEQGRIEAERELYRSVRSLAESASHGKLEEGYAFNKLQEEMDHLKQRDEDSHGYLARIENVLNTIVDYRQEDERRRKQQ
jgi:hypothetical protein